MKKIVLICVVILMTGFVSLHGQSFNFKIGADYPIMGSDLWDTNIENLAFEKQDMVSGYYGVEFELFMGKHLSLALEAGHYSQEIFTAYRDVVYDDDSAIPQDISLRISSFEADFKFYPMGHRNKFNPYFGGGAGLYAWKYIQGGDFVDFEDYTVSEGEAITTTISPGFNVKAGFVYRFRKSIGISVEARYRYLKGELSSQFEGFGKLDLSGATINIGLNLFLR